MSMEDIIYSIGASGTAAIIIAIILAVVAAICALLIYFLPSIIALIRHHHNKAAIIILNIFLGWSFVGWVIALVWCATRVDRGEPIKVIVVDKDYDTDIQ